MVTLNFILKDLSRRKFQTLSTIVALTISMGWLTFPSLLGLGLGFNYSTLPWRASLGLYYVFALFMLMASLLVFLIGLMALSSIASTLTEQRVRDTSIMKAIGLAEEVNSFFIFESLILILVGCGFGVLCGISAYVLLAIIFQTFGYTLILVQPFLVLSILFIIALAVTFPSLYIPLYRNLMALKATEAMTPKTTAISLGTLARSKLISRFSTHFKMALRIALGEKVSLRTLLSIILVSALLSTLIFGGQVIYSTAGSYVKRGIGRGTFLIAHRDVGSFYVDRLSFSQVKGAISINFTNELYEIPNSFIEWLRSKSYVVGSDARFLTELEVCEVKLVKPVPNCYLIIGDDRSAEALVMGVKPRDVLNDWILMGRFPNDGDRETLVIGDSLLDVVYDISQEHLKVLGTKFDISGAVVDPLNGRFTVYMSYEELQTMISFHQPNMIIVQLDLDKVSLRSFEDALKQWNLTLYDLRASLNKNLGFLQGTWLSISSLPSLSLVVGGLVLTNYAALSISGRINDFKIMKAIGAKKKDIERTVLIVVFSFVVLGVIPGVTLGWIFSAYFLISYPSLPSGLTLFSDLLFLASIFVATSLVSVYHVRRMVEKATA